MWNEERFADAVKYRDQGLSAREIADKLGEGLTRSGVLGKFHRAGLANKSMEPDTLRFRLQRRRQRARAALRQAQKSAPAPVVAKPVPTPAPAIPALTVPDVARVASVLDLEAHHCRFPVGEPLEGLCGAPRVDGRSYCQGHCDRAYVTPTPKPPTRPAYHQVGTRAFGHSNRWA